MRICATQYGRVWWAMTRLTREEWVKAGLSALAEGGVENVLVERLARALAVTKGSFYWHFTGREALLAELKLAWERAQTADVIAAVDSAGGSPMDRLRRVVDRIGAMDVPLEAAMRRWATKDRDTHALVERIDAARIAHLQSVIAQAGAPPDLALDRARLLYYAFIGEVAFGRPIPKAERATTAQSNLDLILSGS